MTTTTCDQCGKDAISKERITLTGFRARLVKTSFARDFCSDECFRKWIRAELDAKANSGVEIVDVKLG